MFFKKGIMIAACTGAAQFINPQETQAQSKADFREAVYYNQEFHPNDKVNLGFTTGPVYNFTQKEVTAEVNGYAGFNFTRATSSIALGAKGLFGISAGKDGVEWSTGAVVSANTNLQNKKIAFMNNFYFWASLPFSSNFKDIVRPTLNVGYALPIGKSKKTSLGDRSQSIWFESQLIPQ